MSKFFRQMAKNGETMVATTLNRFGLKPPVPLRRRSHVRKALAAAKAKAKEGTK